MPPIPDAVRQVLSDEQVRRIRNADRKPTTPQEAIKIAQSQPSKKQASDDTNKKASNFGLVKPDASDKPTRATDTGVDTSTEDTRGSEPAPDTSQPKSETTTTQTKELKPVRINQQRLEQASLDASAEQSLDNQAEDIVNDAVQGVELGDRDVVANIGDAQNNGSRPVDIRLTERGRNKLQRRRERRLEQQAERRLERGITIGDGEQQTTVSLDADVASFDTKRVQRDADGDGQPEEVLDVQPSEATQRLIQQQAIANRLDERVPGNVSRTDIRPTEDGGFKLSTDVQQQLLEQRTAQSLSTEDIKVSDDGTVQLTDEAASLEATLTARTSIGGTTTGERASIAAGTVTEAAPRVGGTTEQQRLDIETGSTIDTATLIGGTTEAQREANKNMEVTTERRREQPDKDSANVAGALDDLAGSTDEAVGRVVDSASEGDVAGVTDAVAGSTDEAVGRVVDSASEGDVAGVGDAAAGGLDEAVGQDIQDATDAAVEATQPFAQLGNAFQAQAVDPTARRIGAIVEGDVTSQRDLLNILQPNDKSAADSTVISTDDQRFEPETGVGQATEQTVAGIGSTGTMIVSGPNTVARVGDLGVDAAAFTDEQIDKQGVVQGSATSAKAGATVAKNRLQKTAKQAIENPFRTAGMLAGTGAAFKIAASAGTRTSLATRAAIQPGEELIGFAGSRALSGAGRALSRAGDAVPGRAGAPFSRAGSAANTGSRVLFPDDEPILMSEEAAIRGSRLLGRRIRRTAANVRSLADSDRAQADPSALFGRSETETADDGTTVLTEEDLDVDIEEPSLTSEADQVARQRRVERRLRRERQEGRNEDPPEPRSVEGQDPETIFTSEQQSDIRTVSSEPDTSRSGPTARQQQAFQSAVTEAGSELSPRERQLQAQRSDQANQTTQGAQERADEAQQPDVLRETDGPTGAAVPLAALRSADIQERQQQAQQTKVGDADEQRTLRGATDVFELPETDSRIRSDVFSDIRGDADTRADVRTRTSVEPRTATDVRVGSDLATELETETEADSLFEPETETETETESETETEAETETESETDTEADTEVDLETETDSETETELFPQNEVELFGGTPSGDKADERFDSGIASGAEFLADIQESTDDLGLAESDDETNGVF